MKHSIKSSLFALVVVCGFCVMTSCSPEIFDNTKSLIIGTWELVEESNIDIYDGVASEPKVHNLENLTYTLTFNKDKTCSAVTIDPYGTDNSTGRYKIEGNQILFYDDEGNGEGDFLIIEEIDKKNLTLSSTDTDVIYEGVVYSNKLIMRFVKK